MRVRQRAHSGHGHKAFLAFMPLAKRVSDCFKSGRLRRQYTAPRWVDLGLKQNFCDRANSVPVFFFLSESAWNVQII